MKGRILIVDDEPGIHRTAPAAGYGAFEAGQIVALWSLAVAQPVYDLLARNPEFLVVRGSSLGEVLLFAVGLSLLAPLLLVGVAVLTGLASRTARLALHGLLVTLLAASLVLNAAKRLPLPATALVAGALLAGVLIAWSLRRWSVLRSWTAVLAISAILFPLVFFWRLPATAWGGGEGAPTREMPAPENPVPVVLIVFDQLSTASLLGADGEIDAMSFPNFAALARGATWFPLAKTVHRYTIYAIPAILTGRYPDGRSQPVLAEHPENLFTLLAAHYDITAQETLTRLCPFEICEPEREEEPLTHGQRELWRDLALVYLHILLPETVSARLPPVDQTWMGFGIRGTFVGKTPTDKLGRIRRDRQDTRRDRAAEFLHFLDRVQDKSSPSLYFYASWLPHTPNDYLPSGRRYSQDGTYAGAIGDGHWGDDEWAVLQDEQRYLLQVGFVDRQLGLFMRRLREVGLYDSALLIVTSDHGASFRANDHLRGLTTASFAETLGVALFVKLPDQRQGRRDERGVETIDVLPTILDTLGVELPLDGRSLLTGPSPLGMSGAGGTLRETEWHERFASAELRRGLDEAVRRKIELFGSEGFSTRFYQLGELGHLVGRRVSEMGPLTSSSVETELLYPAQDVELDPARGFVPAHIRGTSRGFDTSQQLYLAIAVNGTIQAVTRTWKESPKHRSGEWSAVVAEDSFVPGANRIEVFHLRRNGRRVELAPTASTMRSSAPATR